MKLKIPNLNGYCAPKNAHTYLISPVPVRSTLDSDTRSDDIQKILWATH